ncbi:MAG: serine hydrolase [Labilithrix sp.]|nr:serine hydrolase [Labilithrix sp.]MCW5813872.1 serine hydrolase [Labilithrix sp.]
MRAVLLAVALVCVAPAAAEAAPCPARAAWPTNGFPRRTEETARLFPERVRALEEYMFTLEGANEDRKGIRTDALMVIHQGAVFYEHYGRGFTAANPHLAWSVSKTVTQLLTGMAVAHGALAIDDSMCRFFPDFGRRCDLTVRHLLEFASGFDWAENYEDDGSRQDSSVVAMLYGEGHRDMASFVLEHDRSDAPGAAYRYSTGDSTLLGGAVDRAMRPRFGDDYPWTVLFDPLGIKEMTIEQDLAGHRVGGAYSWAPPEDWGRLGFFMLNDGCWENGRMLPEDWIAQATTPSEAFLRKRHDVGATDQQGRQLWLNRKLPGVAEQPWPDLPEDTYSAIGHWGQYIAVIPSKDLVIVRSGDDRDDEALDVNRFFKLALALTGEP